MSKKGKGGAAAAANLQKDVPWRATGTASPPIPKIHHSPIIRLPQTPFSNHALSVMKVLLFPLLSLYMFFINFVYIYGYYTFMYILYC